MGCFLSRTLVEGHISYHYSLHLENQKLFIFLKQYKSKLVHLIASFYKYFKFYFLPMNHILLNWEILSHRSLENFSFWFAIFFYSLVYLSRYLKIVIWTYIYVIKLVYMYFFSTRKGQSVVHMQRMLDVVSKKLCFYLAATPPFFTMLCEKLMFFILMFQFDVL